MHLWELSKSGSRRNELSSKRSLKINLRGSFLLSPLDPRKIENEKCLRTSVRFDPFLLIVPGTRLQLGTSDLHSIRCRLLYTDTLDRYRGYRRDRDVGGGSNLKIKKVTRGYGALRNNWRRVQCNRRSYRDRVLGEDKYERGHNLKGFRIVVNFAADINVEVACHVWNVALLNCCVEPSFLR